MNLLIEYFISSNEIRNKYYELKVKPTSIEDIINFLTKNGYEITK